MAAAVAAAPAGAGSGGGGSAGGGGAPALADDGSGSDSEHSGSGSDGSGSDQASDDSGSGSDSEDQEDAEGTADRAAAAVVFPVEGGRRLSRALFEALVPSVYYPALVMLIPDGFRLYSTTATPVDPTSVLTAEQAAQADAATEASLTGGGGAGAGGGGSSGPVVRQLVPVKTLEAKCATSDKSQAVKNEIWYKYGLPEKVQVVEVERIGVGKRAIAMVPHVLNMQPDGTVRKNNGGSCAQVFGLVFGKVVEVGANQRFVPMPLPKDSHKRAVVQAMLMALLFSKPLELRAKVLPTRPELEQFVSMVEKVLVSSAPTNRKMSVMDMLASRYCVDCGLLEKATKAKATKAAPAAKTKAPPKAAPAAKAVKAAPAAKAAKAKAGPAAKAAKAVFASKKRVAEPAPESDEEGDDDDGDGNDSDAAATDHDDDDGAPADADDDEDDDAEDVPAVKVGRVRRRQMRLPVFDDKDGDEYPEVKNKRVPKTLLDTAAERGGSTVQKLLMLCQLACDSNRHVVGKEMTDYAVYCIGDLQWTGFARVDLERQLRLVIVNALRSRESTTESDLKFIRDVVFKAWIAKELCEDKGAAVKGKGTKARRGGGGGGGSGGGGGGGSGRGGGSKVLCTSMFGHIASPSTNTRKRVKLE
jgi:hypothetical protein